MSISALSPPNLFLLASTMLDATLNSLSLSTLVEGAQRNFAAVAARVGNRVWLTPQYWYGLSERGTVCSVKYVCIWTCVLVLLAPRSSPCSCRISSNRPLKLLFLLLLLLLSGCASIRGALWGLPGTASAPSGVVLLLCKASIFSTSCVRASLACLMLSAPVKYLKQHRKNIKCLNV